MCASQQVYMYVLPLQGSQHTFEHIGTVAILRALHASNYDEQSTNNTLLSLLY